MYLISYYLLIFSGDECQKERGESLVSKSSNAHTELDFSGVVESIIKRDGFCALASFLFSQSTYSEHLPCTRLCSRHKNQAGQ